MDTARSFCRRFSVIGRLEPALVQISAVFISSIIFAKLLAGRPLLLADRGGMAEAEGVCQS